MLGRTSNNRFSNTVRALHLKKEKQGKSTMFIDQKMVVTESKMNVNLKCQAVFSHWRYGYAQGLQLTSSNSVNNFNCLCSERINSHWKMFRKRLLGH